MGNPFENAVEAPEKRDEMLEGFLDDADFIFEDLVSGVSRDVARRKFAEFFEISKKGDAALGFTQNLMNANALFCEWLQEEWLVEENELKIEQGGRVSVYDENRLHQSKVHSIQAFIEMFIANNFPRK